MAGNNQPRSFKFYRENEAMAMKSLGLKPTKNSGSGWIEKEDGQNDYVICQLKSTDAQSIRVLQNDIRILEHNALVSHKIPMFAIQFLNTGEVWLMVKPEDLTDVSQYVTDGVVKNRDDSFIINLDNSTDVKPEVHLNKIKSSSKARESFRKERESKYNKTKKAR